MTIKNLNEQRRKHSSGALLSVSDAAYRITRITAEKELLFEAIPDEGVEVFRLILIHPAPVKKY